MWSAGAVISVLPYEPREAAFYCLGDPGPVGGYYVSLSLSEPVPGSVPG